MLSEGLVIGSALMSRFSQDSIDKKTTHMCVSGNTTSEAVDEHVVKMQHAHGKEDSEVFLVTAQHHVDRPGAHQRRSCGARDGLPENSLPT